MDKIKFEAKRSLCDVIMNYIENNDDNSRDAIIKNKELITDERLLKRRSAYRFWRFSIDKILDLIYGYGIRVKGDDMLSYYKNLAYTANIVSSLRDNAPMFVIEHGYKSATYYDVCGFIAAYGNDDHKKIMSKYVKEGELFRFVNEDYFLKVGDNVKYFCFSKEILDRAFCKLSNGISIMDGRFVLSEAGDHNDAFKIKRAFSKAYDNKRLFKEAGVNFFPGFFNSAEKQKESALDLDEKSDYMTPGGSILQRIKISE